MAPEPTHFTGIPDGTLKTAQWVCSPYLPQKEKSTEFSQTTLCTMYQIITGHTFVGSYTQRFFPDHTPAQIACQCGEPVQTVEHMLLSCPIYNAMCHKHLTVRGCP